MKFGKQLEREQLAPWAQHYVQYKGLKKTLKGAERARSQLTMSGSATNSATAYVELYSSSRAFTTQLDRELDKVCRFVSALQGQLDGTRAHIDDARAEGTSPELDAMEATTWAAAAQLFAFVELNYTAFYKAGKKHDKVTGLRLSPAIMTAVDASLLGLALHGGGGSGDPSPAVAGQTPAPPPAIAIVVDVWGEEGRGDATRLSPSSSSILEAVGYDGRVSAADMPSMLAASAEGGSEEEEEEEDEEMAAGQRPLPHVSSWASGDTDEASGGGAGGGAGSAGKLAARWPTSFKSSAAKLASQLATPMAAIRESRASDESGASDTGGEGRGSGPASPTRSKAARVEQQQVATTSTLEAVKTSNLSRENLAAAATLLSATGYDDGGLHSEEGGDVGMPLEEGEGEWGEDTGRRSRSGHTPGVHAGPTSPVEDREQTSYINTLTAAGLVALLVAKTSGDAAGSISTPQAGGASVAAGVVDDEGDKLALQLADRLGRSAKAQQVAYGGASSRSLASVFAATPTSRALGTSDPLDLASTVANLPSVLREEGEGEGLRAPSDWEGQGKASRPSFPCMSGELPTHLSSAALGSGTESASPDEQQTSDSRSGRHVDPLDEVRPELMLVILSQFDAALVDMHKASEAALIAACPELAGNEHSRVRERLKRMARYTLGLLHAHNRVRRTASSVGVLPRRVHDTVLAEKLLLARLQLKLLVSAIEQTNPEAAGAIEVVVASHHALFLQYMSSRVQAPTQYRMRLMHALVQQPGEEGGGSGSGGGGAGQGAAVEADGGRTGAQRTGGRVSLQGSSDEWDSSWVPQPQPSPPDRYASVRHLPAAALRADAAGAEGAAARGRTHRRGQGGRRGSTSESEVDRAGGASPSKALAVLARAGSSRHMHARPPALTPAGTGLDRGDRTDRQRLQSTDSLDILRSDTRLLATPTTGRPAGQSRGRMTRSDSEVEAARALGLERVLRQASDMLPLAEYEEDGDKECEVSGEERGSRRGSAAAFTPYGSAGGRGLPPPPPPVPMEVKGRAAMVAAAAAATAELRQALNFGSHPHGQGSTHTGSAGWVSLLVTALDLMPEGYGLSSPPADAAKPYAPSKASAVSPSDLPWLIWRRFRPPLLDWLPYDYRPAKSLSKDIIAGVTIGVMLVPQGLACASLAGLPPQYGLWSGMVPAILYFLLGTSRHAAVGPMSVPALLLAAGVGALSPSSPEEHARLIMCATFLSGVLYTVMAWSGTGFVTRFVSRPVLSGFQSAAAMLTMASVTKDALGVQLPRAAVLQDQLAGIFGRDGLPKTNPASLVTALLALAVLLGAPKVPHLKAVPSPLVTVVVFVASFALLSAASAEHSVALVGTIPSAWPVPLIPLPRSTAELAALVPVAVSVAIVGLLEHLAVSSNYALKHSYEWSVTSELKALGVANLIGPALSSSMFVAGAFGRSAVFDASGGRTQVGQLVSAGTVILLQLAVLPALAFLPRPALSAIIAVSVSKLIDTGAVRATWRVDPSDALVLLTALLATLFAGVLEGVLFAALASLLLFLAQTTRPVVEELGRLSGTVLYQPLGSVGVEAVPGVKVLRFLAPLFYANAPVLKERLLSEIGRRRRLPPRMRAKALILCFSAVATVDSTALGLLKECIAEAHSNGILLLVASANPAVSRAMERAGVVGALGGPPFLTRRVHEAVRAVLMKRVDKRMVPSLRDAAAAAGAARTPASGAAGVAQTRVGGALGWAHASLAEGWTAVVHRVSGSRGPRAHTELVEHSELVPESEA